MVAAIMAEPITLKYRAFLSYSHDDTRCARRQHRRLALRMLGGVDKIIDG
jgi:hypothetical protein